MVSINKGGLINSILDAFKLGNVIKKALFMFIIISFLSVRELIHYLNVAGENNQPFWTAILPAYMDGLMVVFASIWNLLTQVITLQFSSIPQGDLWFGIIFFLGGMYVVYQPVSILINAFDFREGDATSTLFKIMGTFVVVVIISAWVYYSGDAQSVLSQGFGNEAMNNVTTTNNVTNTSALNESSYQIIDMLE